MKALVFLMCCLGSLAGNILSDHFLSLSCSNAGQNATYTFSFSVQTSIPSHASLTLRVPPQYTLQAVICLEVLCSFTTQEITWQMGSLSTIPYQLKVQMPNPAESGQTGSFRMTTFWAGKPVDQNQQLPGALITAACQEPISQSFRFDNPYLKFTLKANIPEDSSFLVTFQADFVIDDGALECHFEEFPWQLQCSSEGQVVRVTGPPANIDTPLTLCISGVSLPHSSGLTAPFELLVVNRTDPSLYFICTKYPGMEIQPGEIVEIQSGSSPLERECGKRAVYILDFTLHRPVPLGGGIAVELPSACLQCNSSLAPLPCVSSPQRAFLTLTNPLTPGAFQVSLLLVNPDQPSVLSFAVTTYNATGAVIEQAASLGHFDLTYSQNSQSDIEILNIPKEIPIAEYGVLQFYLETRIHGTTEKIEIQLAEGVQCLAPVFCFFGQLATPCVWDSESRTLTVQRLAESLPMSLLTVGSPDIGCRLDPTVSLGQQSFTFLVFVDGLLVEESQFKYVPQPKELTSPKGTAAGSLSVSVLHYAAQAPNALFLVLKPSISVPQALVKIQFLTGFEANLGWTLGELVPCVLSDDLLCMLGLSDGLPTITIAGAVLSRDSYFNISLPRILNGAVGNKLQFVLTTALTSGEDMETRTFLSTNFLHSSTPALFPDITLAVEGSNSADDISTRLVLKVGVDMSVGEAITVVFPSGYEWDATATSLQARGNFPSFKASLFRQSGFRMLLLQVQEQLTSPVDITFDLPHNHMYARPPTLRLAVSSAVTYNSTQVTLQAPSVLSFISPSCSEQIPGPSLSSTRTLLAFSFQPSSRLPLQASISLLFPLDFASLDQECFHLIRAPPGTQCRAEQTYVHEEVTYRRYVLTNFGVTDTGSFLLRVFVTSGPTQGSVSILLLSNYHGEGTSQQIHSSVLSFTLAQSLPSVTFAPSGISAYSDLAEPLTSLAAGKQVNIHFLLILAYSLNKCTQGTLSGLRVTFPLQGYVAQGNPTPHTGFFTADGPPECYFNQTRASSCEFQGQVLTVWTPLNSDLLAGTIYELILSTDGAGFTVPASGQYSFLFQTFTDTNPAVESGEAWMWIPPLPFKVAYVRSLNKAALQYTVLQVNFTISVPIKSAIHASSPGFLYLEFPFAAWKVDLGSGLTNGAALPCYPLVSLVPVQCFLEYGDPGPVRIRLEPGADLATDDQFSIILTGIVNPNAGTDVKICLHSYSHILGNNPYWIMRESTCLNNVDTIMGPILTPSTSSTLSPWFEPSLIGSPNADMTLQLFIKVSANAVSTNVILMRLSTELQVSSSPSCSLEGTSLQCVVMAQWVLVFLKGAVSPGTYNLKLSSVTLPSYQDLFKMTAYYILDRKTVRIQPYSYSNLSLGSCTWCSINSVQQAYAFLPETYRLAFKCDHKIPSSGHLVITFPAAFANTIQASTCLLGPRSQLQRQDVSCSLDGSKLSVGGLGQALLAGVILEIEVVASPTEPGVYSDFSLTTYPETEENKLVDQVIGSSTQPLTITALPKANAMPQLSIGPTFGVLTHSQNAVRSNGEKCGVLEISMTPDYTVIGEAGFLTIISKRPISVSADLRCLWKSHQIRLGSCSFTSPSTIKVFTSSDLPAGVAVSLEITATNVDYGQGVCMLDGPGLYPFSLTLFTGSLYLQGQVYVEVQPAHIDVMEIYYNHQTAGLLNGLVIKFKTPVDISSQTGRLVVELPLFPANLGYYSPNGQVSCLSVGTLVPTDSQIFCYLMQREVPTIVITGFASVSAGTEGLEFHLYRLQNPLVSGDDQMVSLNFYILDVAQGWPGVKLAQRLVSNIFAVQPNNANLKSASAPLIIGSNTVASVVSLQFQVPATEVEDRYYLTLDPRLTLSLASCTEAVCWYYSDAHIVVLKFSIPFAGGLITLKDFTAPAHELDSPLQITGIAIHSLEVSSVVTYSPISLPFFQRISNTAATLARADGAPNIYANDREDWVIGITFSLPLQSTGGMRLLLSGNASFPESVCINAIGSQLTGTLTCVAAGQTMTMSFSHQQPQGSSLMLVVPVATGSSTTVSVITYSSTLLTVQEEAILTPIYKSSSSTYHNIPLQLQIPKIYRFQDTGMLTLSINLPIAIPPGKTLTLTLPAGVVSAAGGSLLCYFASHSTVCSQVGTLVTIQSPAASGIPLGRKTLQITTTNADVSEEQGLYFNPTGGIGEYLISLSYENYSGTCVLNMLPKTDFTTLTVEKGFERASASTFFRVSFTVKIAIDAIQFCWPTATLLGQALFGSDLGTGIADKQALPCEPSGGIASASCTLLHGRDQQPACVLVSGFSPLSPGASGQIFIGGLTNPSDYGNGDRHVDFSAIGYLGTPTSNHRVCAQILFGIYTLQPPPEILHSQLPVPTLQVSRTNTGNTLNISCGVVNSLTIIQLPKGFTPTTATASVCTPHAPWNWYVCTSCTQTIDLLATSLKSTLSDRIIVVMQSDSVKYYDPFAQLSPYLGGSASLLPQFASGPQGKTDFWKASYTLTQALPSTGCFQVLYSVAPAHSACWPSAGSSFAALEYSCDISDSTLTFSGFTGDLPVGTVLSVISQLNSGLETSLSASFTTWAVCRESEIEASSTSIPSVISGLGASAFTYGSVEGIREPVQLAGRGEIQFYVIPPMDITTGMTIDVTLDFQPSAELFCQISGPVDVPTLCYFEAPDTVHISSTAGFLAGQQLQVRISATSQDQGLHGLLFSSARHHFEVSIVAAGVPSAKGVLDYTPASGAFSSARITTLHVSHKAPTVFTIAFTNGVTALTATDELVLELPSSSEDGLRPGFADDLGTGQTGIDSELSCAFTGYTGNPRCVLIRGNRALKINPKVVVKGGLLSAGGQATIKLAGVWNPDASGSSSQGDDYIMYFRLYSASQSGLVYCDQYLFAVYSLDVSPQQPFTATWSSASQAHTWDSQSYTLTLGGVPADVTAVALLISSTDAYFYLDSVQTGTYFPTHNTLLVTVAGLATSLTIKAPPHSLSLATTFVHVIVLSGERTLYLGKASASFPTALSRDKDSGFVLALQSHDFWWQGYWGPLTTLVTTSTAIPGAYLRISVNTDSDIGSIMPRGFGNDIEKVRWRVNGNDNWFWGFNTLTNPQLGANLYVKGVAEVQVTVSLCMDLACTQVFASDSASVEVPTSLYPAFSTPTYISSKPIAQQSNLSWQLTFTLTAPIVGYTSVDDYESICLKLLDFNIGPEKSLTTCTIDNTPCATGNWDPIQSQYCFASSAQLAAGSHTAEFSIIATSNEGPTAPAASGFTYVCLFTWKQSVSTVTNYEFLRVQVLSQKDISGCPLLMSSGGGALSVVNSYLNSSDSIAKGSFLFFVFAGVFAPDLGRGVLPGEKVSAYSSVSSTDCFLTQVSSFFNQVVSPGVYPAIACVLGNSVATTTTMRFAFPILTPAGSSVTEYKEMLLYTYTNGVPELKASGGCSQVSSYTNACSSQAGAPRSGVQSGANIVFSLPFNLANTALSGSTFFLLILGPDFDATLVSGATSLAVDLVITGPAPCPCVLLRYTGSANLNPVVSVNLQAPATQSTFTLLAYPLTSSPSCDPLHSFPLVTDSVPSLETLTLDNTGPFYANQDILLKLSWSGGVNIPTNSCIQLQFSNMQGFLIDTIGFSGSAAKEGVEASISGSLLSLKGIGLIEAHKTVQITGIFAILTSSFQITVETFAKEDCTGRMHSSTTTLAPTIAVSGNLSRTALWPGLPSLLTGERSGANQALVFSPTFRSVLQPMTEFLIKFPAALPSTSRYFAIWESSTHTQLLGKVETTASGLRIFGPTHVQLAAGKWTATVTAQEGLVLPKNQVLRFEWTSSAGTESAGDYPVPVSSHFQALSVQNLGQNTSFRTALLVQMTITTTTSANPEILLQFEGRSDALGSGLSSGEVLPCGVYVGTLAVRNLVKTAVCRLYPAEHYTAETSVVVKGLSTLNSGKVVSLVLGGIQNPSEGSTTNLRVTTHTWTASALASDQYTLHDSQLYEAAVLTTTSSSSEESLTAPSVPLLKVGAISNWQFTLPSPSIPVSTIVLIFNPTVYEANYLATTFASTTAAISVTSSGSPLSPEVLLIPALGWVVLKLPSSVTGDFTVDIVDAKGPMHVPASLEVSAFSVSAFANHLSQIVSVYSFSSVSFVQDLLWVADPVSPTAPLGLFNPFGSLSNLYPADTLLEFKVQLKTINPVPKAGYLSVKFPNWQNIGNCFSSLGSCTSGLLWKVQGSFPANTIVEIWGEVTSPATSGTFQVEVSSRLDDARVIDAIARGVSITACCGLAAKDFLSPIPVDYTERLARSLQNGVLSLLFQPTQALTGTITITAPGFLFPATPLCRFSLKNAPEVSYTATCTSSTANFSASPLLANQIYLLQLFAVTFPDYVSTPLSLWTVQVNYGGVLEEWQETYQVFPAATSQVKVVTKCASAGIKESVLLVSIATSLSPPVSIVFPAQTRLGDPHFLTNNSEGLDRSCKNTSGSPVFCVEKHFYPVSWASHSIVIELSEKNAYVPGVTNPQTQETAVSIGVFIYGTHNGQRIIRDGTYITIYSTENTPQILSKPSFLKDLLNKSTGHGTASLPLSLDSTDGGPGFTLEIGQSLLIFFSFPIDTALSVSMMTALFPTHGLALVTNSGATPLTSLTVTFARLASFDAFTPPAITVMLISPSANAHVQQILQYKDNTNFTPAADTLTILPALSLLNRVKSLFSVTLTCINGVLPGTAVKIVFPSFELESCHYVSQSLAGVVSAATPTTGHLHPCAVSGSSAVVRLLRANPDNTQITISLWGVPSVLATSATAVTYVEGSPDLTQGSATVSLTVASNSPLSGLKPVSPMLQSPERIVFKDSVAPFSASVRLSAALNPNDSITFTFESGVVEFVPSYPPYLTCLWGIAGRNYLASGCQLNSNILEIWAPRHTSLAKNTPCTLTVTTTLNKGLEGLKFHNPTNRYTTVLAQTGSDAGQTTFLLPPAPPTSLSLKPLSHSTGQPTALSLLFSASSDLGGEVVLKMSEVMLQPGGVRMLPCSSASNVQCYGKQEAIIKLQGTLAAGLSAKVLLLQLMNPYVSNMFISFSVAFRSWTGSAYVVSAYTRSLYLYSTLDFAANIKTEQMPPVKVQTSMSLSHPLSSPASLLLITFDSVCDTTQLAYSGTVTYLHLGNTWSFIDPTGTIELQGFGTPVAPVACSYSYYVLRNLKYDEERTIQVSSYTPYSLTCYIESLQTSPHAGQTAIYTLSFSTVAVPAGGTIVVTVPAQLSDLGNCVVVSGLMLWTCSAQADNYEITAISSYIPSTQLVLSLTLIGQSAGSTDPFKVSAYGSDLTIPISSGTCSNPNSLQIASAPRLNILKIEGRSSTRPACLTQHADLNLVITPSVAYQPGDSITVQFPAGVIPPTTPLVCLWTNSTNTIPLEKYSVSTSQVTIIIPDQVLVQAYVSYGLSLRSESGFLLPIAIDTGVLGFYIVIKTPGNMIREAGKVLARVCGAPFSYMQLQPGHHTVAQPNFLLLSFKISTSVSASGQLILTFPEQVTFSGELNCLFESGIRPKCIVAGANVVVSVSEGLGAGVSYKLRIAGFTNPAEATDSVHGNPSENNVIVKIFDKRTEIYIARNLPLFPLLLQTTVPPSLSGTAAISGTDQVQTFLSDPSNLSITLTDDPNTTPASTIRVVFDSVFQLPEDFAVCTVGGLSATCYQYPALGWLIVETAALSAGTELRLSNINTPVYTSPTGYSIRVDVFSNTGSWVGSYPVSLSPLKPANCSFQVNRSSPALALARSTYDMYTMSWNIPYTSVMRIDLLFPSEFPWIAASCLVNVETAVCVSDCNTETCSKKVTVKGTLSGEIEITIGVFSPNSAGNTAEFKVTAYASQSDLSRIIAAGQVTGLTVQSHISLFDYMVFWVPQPLISLNIQEGQFGTLKIAMKSALSPGSLLTLSFSADIQIAPEASPVCSIRFGSNPLTEFPLYRPRKAILAMDTAWDSGILTLRLPGSILREWYGTNTLQFFLVECTSTRGANGEAGFGASKPGFYAVSIKTPSETLTAEFVVDPIPLTTLSVVPSLLDAGAEVVLTVEFTPNCDIPNGFPSINAGNVGAESWIVVNFDVYTGFAPDLGNNYENGESVSCQGFKGLIGTVSCVFRAGDQSLRIPAQILVSGYKSLSAGTQIELKFAKIRYPLTTDRNPKVTVGVMHTNEQSKEGWILSPSTVSLPFPVQSTSQTGKETGLRLSTSLIYSNSTLYFPLSPVALYPGDTITVNLEGFQVNPDFEVSLNGLKLTNVYWIGSNILVCSVSAETILTNNSELEVKGLVNPLIPGPVTLNWSVITANRKQYETSGEVTIEIGQTSINKLALSNYKAEAVYVNMDISLQVPSAPTASAFLTIMLPETYPILTQSSPIPTCSCSLVSSSCTVSGRSVTISAVFPVKTTISFTIKSMKNPSNTGQITGFSLQGTDSKGRIWTQTSAFPSLSLTSPAPIATLLLTISPAILTSGVVTRYSITLQADLPLPPKAYFKVKFPQGYSLGSEVNCGEVSGIEVYSACRLDSSSVVRLTTLEAIAENTKIALQLEGVKSPIGLLGPFSATAEYDSKVLARSSNLQISLSPAPISTLSFRSITLTPYNEGEIATYTISLKLDVALSPASTYILRIRFPNDFSPNLASFSSQISSASLLFKQSAAAGQREVDFWDCTAEVAAGSVVSLTVFGVVNPWRGQTGSFAAYLLDPAERAALAYTDTGGTVTITPPRILPSATNSTSTKSAPYVFNLQFYRGSQGVDRGGVYSTRRDFTPYFYIAPGDFPVGAGPRGTYFRPYNRLEVFPKIPITDSLALDFTIYLIRPGTILSFSSFLTVEASADGYLSITVQGITSKTPIPLGNTWQRVVIYLSPGDVGCSYQACSGKYHAYGQTARNFPTTEPTELVFGGFEGFLLNATLYNTTNVLIECGLETQPSSCLITQAPDSTCTPCAKGCLSCFSADYCGPCANSLWEDCSLSYSQASSCLPAASGPYCELACPEYCLSCAVVPSNPNCMWCQKSKTGDLICPQQTYPPYPLSACLNCNHTDANMPTFALVSGLRAAPVLFISPANYTRTLLLYCGAIDAVCTLNMSQIPAYQEAYVEIIVGVPLAIESSQFLLSVKELAGLPVLDIVIEVETALNTPISVLFTPVIQLSVSVAATFRLSLQQEPLGTVTLTIVSLQREVECSPSMVNITGREDAEITCIARDGATDGTLTISSLGNLFQVTNPSQTVLITPVPHEIPSLLSVNVTVVSRTKAKVIVLMDRYAQISYLVLSDRKATRIRRFYTNIEDFKCEMWLNNLAPGTNYTLKINWGGIKQGKQHWNEVPFRTHEPWEIRK